MTSKRGKSLSMDDILGADDIEIEAVECPEWGGTVHVRTLMADTQDRLESEFGGKGTKIGIRAAMVAAAMCDADGNFLNPTPVEVQALGKKSARAVDRVADAVIRLNKASAADVERLEKNSAATADADSG